MTGLSTRAAMPRGWRLAAIATALLLTALLFAGGRAPEAGALFPHPWDKLAHAVFFGLLAALWYLGLGARGAVAPFLLAFVTGCLDELHQSTLATRQADVYDLVADAVGAALAIALASKLASRVSATREPAARTGAGR